jgi:hypothetical protein
MRIIKMSTKYFMAISIGKMDYVDERVGARPVRAEGRPLIDLKGGRYRNSLVIPLGKEWEIFTPRKLGSVRL